jgi:GH24 family phage-related lysozyme (muramidase)
VKDPAGTIAMLQNFEGNYSHMYVDTRGYVTVGVGFMIPSAVAALAYTFYLANPRAAHPPHARGTHPHVAPRAYVPSTPPTNPSGDQANANEIKAEWTQMHARPSGHLAGWYAQYATMYMIQSDINQLLQTKINGFEGQLSSLFATWNDFPAPAQLALLDMFYNLGSLGGYPKLCDAARYHEWTKCAAECHRAGPSDARNNATRDRFLAAAGEQQPLPRPGTHHHHHHPAHT